ncbi:hypothetical protein [Mycobacterium sp. SMC-4]|uniref:Rv1733c family protein n=1 Tax=Mycobacterium sp. SMC-4 TaxID=2857059 RepID=UPI0021B443FE|nr:hypothetical protein [Mycobacterium sp. SMC-4]UXA18986.1 hypothetical protein KXD98_04750 [Mycobacterium sp. SMC-4]
MQTFTLGIGVWARRLAARNPLVRATDRMEAAVILLVATLSILAIPVAGAVGTAEYDRLMVTISEQQLTRQQVEATAVAESRAAPQPYQMRYLTAVEWEFAGTTHSDEIRTPRLSAGDSVPIWIDESGVRARPPLTGEDAAAAAVSSALGFWLVASALGVAVWLAVRLRLIHNRFQEWDRELDDLADNGGRANNAS